MVTNESKEDIIRTNILSTNFIKLQWVKSICCSSIQVGDQELTVNLRVLNMKDFDLILVIDFQNKNMV